VADLVNHPPHYTSHPSGTECLDVVSLLGFCLGNALKYVWRFDQKGGVEDLKKANFYFCYFLKREWPVELVGSASRTLFVGLMLRVLVHETDILKRIVFASVLAALNFEDPSLLTDAVEALRERILLEDPTYVLPDEF